MHKKRENSSIRIIPTAFFICLFISLVFMSCSSNKNVFEQYTDEEASYAMEVALSKAIINTGEDFLKTVVYSYDFIPPSYSVLKQNQEKIIGVKHLLSDWKSYFSAYLEDSYNTFSDLLLQLCSEIQFEKPKEFVKRSSTSGSDFFLKIFGSKILSYIEKLIYEADKSYLEKARYQYNADTRIRNYIEKTSVPLLEHSDVVSELGITIYSLFADLLMENEDLFRTTPDPYGDPLIKAVFGNE